MSVLPLTYHPHIVLRMKLQPVNLDALVQPSMQKLIDSMIETMFAKNGIGIAANQVGGNHSIAIISTDEGPVTIVNPKIAKHSFRKEDGDEGCLSIPGVFGHVKRHKTLVLEAFDRKGKKFTLNAQGLLARVIQHEVDHLNGFLCIDRMTKVIEGTMPDGRKKI